MAAWCHWLADAGRDCAQRAGRRVELVEVALMAAWVRELDSLALRRSPAT